VLQAQQESTQEVFTEEQEEECNRELSSLMERLVQVSVGCTQTHPFACQFCGCPFHNLSQQSRQTTLCIVARIICQRIGCAN